MKTKGKDTPESIHLQLMKRDFGTTKN
uniref:Uncharacterized protein n=1 Tax=Leersia perrieri TaxID=77586 RepID=A0A0D9Y1I1_9ORYZ